MDGIIGLWCLPQHSVDMLLTAPPYGTTKNDWDTPLSLPEFLAAVQRAVKPNGAILLSAQCPYDKVLGTSNLKMLRYEWVWCKPSGTGFLNANRTPLKKTENILVFSEKAPAYFPQFEQGKLYSRNYRNSGLSTNYGKFERKFSEYDGKRFPCNNLYFSHDPHGIPPTQKPVALCEYLIKTYTQPGELVADICAGSGTTAVAAIRTGRSFVCFENNPDIYAAALERIYGALSDVSDKTYLNRSE